MRRGAKLAHDEPRTEEVLVRPLQMLSVLAVAVLLCPTVPATATIHWTPAHELAPQGYACRMAAGDLDGDGDIDISLFDAVPIAQFWNVGTPTEPAWQFGPTPYSDVPACTGRNGGLGDLDADGDLDLVLTCWYDDFVRCYWNVGTSSSPAWEEDLSVFDGVVVYGGHYCPRLADMDGDGDLDAMICITNGRVQYVRNVGNSLLPHYEDTGLIYDIPVVNGPGPTIGLGDLDSDGDLDIVRVSYDTAPECFENVGTPQDFVYEENPDMLQGVSLNRVEGAGGVDLLDIDADGDPDLIFAKGFGENLLFLNEGATPVEPTSWGVIKAMYR